MLAPGQRVLFCSDIKEPMIQMRGVSKSSERNLLLLAMNEPATIHNCFSLRHKTTDDATRTLF